MIVIIDYGVGNLASVKSALDKLGIKNIVSSDLSEIKKARALILPGVGAAGQGMKNLKANGLDKLIIAEISKGKPFLGICLGMQLLFESSEEGNIKCLGILKGIVKKFKEERKIPQIGWNKVRIKQLNNLTIKQLLEDITNNSYFYFINSYYCKPEDKNIVVGLTKYGQTFASIIVKDNVIGVQFHPEKSGLVGFKLLKNFVEGTLNVS